MDTVAKSDAFFFITTVCVILVTLIIVILGAYIIRVVSDVKYITRKAKTETDNLADDLRGAREHFKEKGKGFAALLSSFASFAHARKRRKDKKDSQ